MKCEECGAETERDSVFKVILKGNKKKFLCPTCFDFKKYKKGKRSIKEFIAGLLFVPVLVLYGPVPWFFLNIYILTIMLYACIGLHELGHALGGLLTRIKLLEISFGRGRRLYYKKLFGVYVEFCIEPGGGHVHFLHQNGRAIKVKEFLFYAMGPAVNIIIFFILITRFHETVAKESFFDTPAPVLSFAMANLYIGIRNLLPFRHQSDLGPISSDGMSLLKIIQGKKIDVPGDTENILFQSWLAYRYRDYKACKDLSKAAMEKDKKNVVAQRLYALAGIGLREYTEAIRYYKKRLEGSDLDEGDRATTQSNLAYYYLLACNQANYDKALELTEEAMAVCSWDLSVRSNYGGLNVFAGDVDKGIDVLTDKRFTMRSKEDQAEIHCLLAIGWAKKGNSKLAKNRLEKARKLDNQCVFLPIAAEALVEAIG